MGQPAPLQRVGARGPARVRRPRHGAHHHPRAAAHARRAVRPRRVDGQAAAAAAAGSDAQPALVIGRHYINERDSAPVQYNGIM